MEDRPKAEPIVDISCQQGMTCDRSTFSTGNRSLGQSEVSMVYFSFHHRILSIREFNLICNLLFTLRTRGGEILL